MQCLERRLEERREYEAEFQCPDSARYAIQRELLENS